MKIKCLYSTFFPVKKRGRQKKTNSQIVREKIIPIIWGQEKIGMTLFLSCSHFYLLLSCCLLALVNIPGLKMYSCRWWQFSEVFFQLRTNFSSWTNIAFSPCQNTSAPQVLFVWVADLIGGKTMICCLWFSFFQGM